MKNLHREWQQKHDALAVLKQSASERQARLELLQYQVHELEKLELQDAELRELPEEQVRLANAEKLRSTVQSSLYELYDAEQSSTHQALSQITRSLEELLDYDPKLKDIVTMLDNASIQIQEASSDLRNYLDTIELDPERLAWIEERIGVIHDLSRKHHISPEALPDLHNVLSTELHNLSDADQNLETLEQEIQALQQQYHALATQLGEKRSKAAKKLDKSVTDTIRELGMPSTSFTIQLLRSEEDNISIHGYEKIEFMISPNPGQPQKPLRKIASGGELSRISLAIQTVLADSTHIPTLVYDEVDAGIGGPTAEVVGKKLRTLGEKRQVLCVTHLAQVASQAHQHLLVAKQVHKNTTTSTVQTLDQTQRIDETARMLGGIDITEQSLSHAREMIERGQLTKKKQVKKSRKSA
jgi:DNA repair protein RecN (Recombination protein N)